MSRVLAHQLEASVLERRNHELARIVQRLAGSGDVRNIMVVNPAGKVVVSSDGSLLGRTLPRHDEPGCRECHASVVLKETTYLKDAQGRPFYRNVTVIQNRPACFACHDPGSSINGIFITDFSQDNLESQIRSSLIRLLLMGAAMLAVTIAVLYLLLNHLVLKRLKRFADAAEQIGPHRFGRVSMPGDDEFSQLATSFNLMSQRLNSAIKEIEGTKEYLETVINNIDDEIIVLNRNFAVVTANAAHLRNRRELTHQEESPEGNRDAGTKEERHSYERCACTNTFRDGQVHKILQTEMLPDGKEKFVEVYCSPLKNEAGEVYEVIEVRRDITERKLLEANLAHSERLISMGLLASGLSHEINNPLASISTFVEGLKRRLEKSPSPSQEWFKGLENSLGLIQKEIDRAKDVTRRLLILAQKDESSRSLVDLNESLQETVLLVRYEASKRGIQINVEPGPDMPTMKLSESQVRQVFLNLLLNSLQACNQGGHVCCRTWREDGRVCASVEDDGHGIEPVELVRIFEPFFSKKPSGQGTGLGLFICRSIASSWGGTIFVESRIGKGAKFTVWIPIQP